MLCPIQYHHHHSDGHQSWPTWRYFRFPQSWAVVGKDDQFCFALSDHLQSLLVPEHIFSIFPNKMEPKVDWLCGHHLSDLGEGWPTTKINLQDLPFTFQTSGVQQRNLRDCYGLKFNYCYRQVFFFSIYISTLYNY